MFLTSRRCITRLFTQLKAIIPVVMIGASFFSDPRMAFAACSGDISVSTALATPQANATWLCSYSVTNSGSVSINTLNNGALENTGIINNLTNSGSLTSSVFDTNFGIKNTGSSSISSLVNTGTISSSNVGISNNTTISWLENSGTISGASKGIGNTSGTISTIVNSGTISSSTGTGIYIQTKTGVASIGTITNTGTVIGATTGINNVNATLGVLNNRQGAGNANGALTYTGVLPNYYNVIIASPVSYGQLSATSITNASGTSGITFNIYGNTDTTLVSGVSASTIAIGTYSSVLTGFTSDQIASSSLNGTYAGGYTWRLQNSSGTSWDLIVSTNINSGDIVTLSALGNTYNPVLSGGTLVLFNGDSSAIAISITSSGGVIQSPSSGSATLSGALTGPGGLTFTGTGTTILTGTNTYSGGTTVSSGTLQGNTNSLQGAITNNSTVIFDQSTTGTYSGVMSGSGNLTKQGAGTLVLTGTNTYSGGTTVSSGTLSVAGISPTGSGNVYVAFDGSLIGTGSMTGNLTVNGVLKPGNSPGYLSVIPNVVLNTGSTYQQDIAGQTPASASTPIGATGYYSVLNVGRQVTINAGSTLTPRISNLFSAGESGYGSTIYVPVLGDRFRIMTANGGISGRFTTVTQPAELTAGTQFLPFYNMVGSNSLDLVVIPKSYAMTIALNSGNKNAQSVGASLDKMVVANQAGVSTLAQDQLLYAGSTQTASTLYSYAQSLAGEVYAATVAVIAQTTQRVQQAVLTRLGDTMGIGLPNAMTSPAGNTSLMGTSNTVLSGGTASSAVSSNPGVNPEAEYKSLTNGNVWGDLVYQKGNRSSDSNSGGWNSNLYQLVFGSDFYVANGMRVGGGIGLSSTTLNPIYGSGTIQQGSVFAYGKLPVDVYVVDAMVSFGLNSSDLSRGDITGLSNGFRNKTISGNDAMVSLGLSRPIDTESLRITPYARVTWQIVTQSGVSEGDTASALSVNSYTGNGVRGMLGVALGSKTNNPMTEPFTYRAYVSIGVDSSSLLNPMLNASLAGMSTNIRTPNAGTTFVQAGLYGTAKVSDNAYAFAGLSGEARSGQTLGAVNVGIRIQF